MKAGKGFSTWHSCMSVAVVGAMAFAVSVQGSPRAGERGKTDDKSGTSRLVTGPSAHINDAIAAGPGASFTLQPVAPKTDPASSYPAGTTIVGTTINMGSVPARVWFEIQVDGYPNNASPDCLKTIQARIDATDNQMNGGGYAASTCGGLPATGAGSLTNADQPCPSANAAGHAVCRQTMSGRPAGAAGNCALGEPDTCAAAGVGFKCNYGFQDQCDAEWIAGGFGSIPAADTSTPNFRAGATVNDPDPSICMNDFNPSYLATLVIDVPANAKGTYTIDFGTNESFMQDGNQAFIPIVAFNSAFVKIQCGSCCFGVGGAAPGCANSLSATECAAQPQPAIFTPDGACQNPPTDDGCCACLTNAQCNDNDACTTDICNNCVCSNAPKATWDQVAECCDAASGTETALGCADQCEAASCSAGGNRGTATCTATPGAACDDDNPCSYDDTCAAGAGSCAGLDANLVACATSADCAAATDVGYPCIDGFCNCTLTPDLDIEIVDLGEENCFDTGEKITACVHIAASSSPVNGGQVLLSYDPTCLDYNSTIQAEPYTNGVYGPVVNEAAGSIFVAVGVEFGTGNGPNGNADLVCFSFNKVGSCNSCQLCPLSNNPQNTYLTDANGQRITVQANCSKDILSNSALTLKTPTNIKTNVDCDHPTAVESWDAPSASSACGGATQVFCRGEHESGLQYDSATANGGGEFPLGASSFCCYAVADGPCGSTVGCPPDTNCVDADSNGKPDGCWTVTVNDETSLDITVGLAPGSQSNPGGTVTRCIKFTLYQNCAQEPLVFSDDVTFGGLFEYVGKSTGKIKIPGSGQYSCITAQDQLHTLRSCYTFAAADCAGGQLNARFSGDPRLGGNWLIGGNLDGWKKDDPNSNPSLDTIDILDFGTFVAEYLSNYGSIDTPCGTAGPNADINGDGIADLDDYAFISSNFLVNSKQCCCGPQAASVNVVTEISVAQLRAEGLGELAVGDLNGDGLLNLADMASFDQGVRPVQKNSTKGGSRTGSR
jgi:hypothetical protein